MATNDVDAPHPARKHTPMPARAIAPSPLERQVGALTDTLVSILCAEAELSTADPNVSAIDAAIRAAEALWQDAATRVAALLELGMGFHPDFTGRQNVFMAGQLLGLRQQALGAHGGGVCGCGHGGRHGVFPRRQDKTGGSCRHAGRHGNPLSARDSPEVQPGRGAASALAQRALVRSAHTSPPAGDRRAAMGGVQEAVAAGGGSVVCCSCCTQASTPASAASTAPAT